MVPDNIYKISWKSMKINTLYPQIITSIKQSPVLKVIFFLVLWWKISYRLNLFYEFTCIKRPLFLCPNGDLSIQMWLYYYKNNKKTWPTLEWRKVFFSFSYKYIFFPENYVVGSLLLSFDRKKKSLVHNINLGQKCSYWPHMYICIQACVFCLLAKLDIFPLMCADDKVWITELTLIHKNIRSVCNSHISQSDVKHIMTSQIKTI